MEKKVSKFVELFDGLPDQRQEWKTMRGSSCRSKLPLHVVSAWFSGTGMILRQEYTQEKKSDYVLAVKGSRTEDKATGKACEETRYYISSLPADAERFAYAVRQHWGVESMHWSLDTTFNEDGRRGHKDNAAKNLAHLLRLAYDILKSVPMPAQGKKMPLKRMRKKAMLDERYLYG